MPSDDHMREILAQELNKARGPDQKPITASMFRDPVYSPYVAAMQRVYQLGHDDGAISTTWSEI